MTFQLKHLQYNFHAYFNFICISSLQKGRFFRTSRFPLYLLQNGVTKGYIRSAAAHWPKLPPLALFELYKHLVLNKQ